MIPPFSTTPSAPTKTKSTLLIIFATPLSKITVTGIPASCKYFAALYLLKK